MTSTPPTPGSRAPLEPMRALLAQLESPGELLEAIFASAPVGLQIYAHDGRCVLVNPFHTELFGGVPPPEFNVFEDTILLERGVVDQIRRAFAGERVVIPPLWYDIRDLRNISVREGGRRIAVGAELVPLRTAATGRIDYVLFVFHDMTAAHEAREAAERAAIEADHARTAAEQAAAHSAFLAEAGRVLAASLDYETTLVQLAQLATPTLADFCVVDVVGEDGTLRRVAATHADPEVQPLLDTLCRKYPPRYGSPQPAMRAITSRRPELLSEVDPEVVAAHTLDDEHRELMLRLGVRSHLAVPLSLGERTLGAISLGYVGTRRYRAADVPLAEALASRAAVAIENARLYRDAESARAEAEAASRAKDEFLAMLGHELRNPLAPIVTALELTRLREGPSRERAIIERQVEHVRRLVDDLLDVARITRGKLELERAPLDLSDAVRDGIELARPLIAERRHRLEVALPAQAMVLGDRVRLAQVVANLLTNAARYTEPGGTISVRLERATDQLSLRVTDTGIGIPPELLPRVFELFAQGKRLMDRASGGLGLGLAIVKAIVELHGGRVQAASAGAGRGSELLVELPSLISAGMAAPEALAPEPPRPSSALCVMVVDDNADAAELMAELLELSGYETCTAGNASEALVLARARKPQVALVDIGLPGMDGYELARRLRADPLLQDLRLVALTGYGQDGDRAQSRAAGFSHHLVKPVDLNEVLTIIEGLVRQATLG